MFINKIEELPEEVMQEIRDKWKEGPEFKFEDMEEFQDGIREGGNYKERVDSCYVYCDYYMTTESYRLEATGASYRKDQCICDEEWEEGVEIINLAEAKAKEVAAAQFKIDESNRKWENLLKSLNLEQTNQGTLLDELQKYNFPTLRK